jgi:hypothetical protein
VPHLAQIHAMLRGAPPAGPLYDAWRATALGAQLAFGLMLPQLTPAAEIALWRRAAGEARETPALHTAAAQAGVRTLTPERAASVTATLAAGPAALLDFRSWLAERWNYAPA